MPNIIKFDLEWKRPQTVPFPYIWRRFEVKSSNGEVQKVRIQDLTQDRHEEAWQFCVANLWSQEPVSKALKLVEDEKVFEGIKYVNFKIMNQNLSKIAVLDQPDNPRPPMIGYCGLAAYSRSDDLLIRLEGDKALRYEKLYDALHKDINIFDIYGVDIYLEDCGVTVLPAYGGRQIAANMIDSVAESAKVFGICVKTVALTNLKLEAHVKKEGLEVLREIFYDDFRFENGEIVVPVKEFKSIRYCALKFS